MSRMSLDQGDSSSVAGPEDSRQDLHLWKLPRGRHGLSPELVARSQRERLIAAVVRVTAAKGYQATSVADILKAAGVGRESFYRYFENKEDCFLAANDMLIDDLEAGVVEAYGQPAPWPARVRMGLAKVLTWLAADPDIARVMMIEMGTVGPVATERFHATFHRFTALLDDREKSLEEAPVDLPNLPSIAGGAVFARIYEEVALGDSRRLLEFLPQLSFELLLPYIGEGAAAKERKAAEKELAAVSDGN
jgi:AcrR family transcriptional regulator